MYKRIREVLFYSVWWPTLIIASPVVVFVVFVHGANWDDFKSLIEGVVTCDGMLE